MCFNRAARQLLVEFGCRDPVSHDWWVYLTVTGAGGLARYDPVPSIEYRQHAENLIGAGGGWLARMTRFRELAAGRVSRWNAANLKALGIAEDHLSPENQETVRLFSKARDAARPFSLLYLYRSGVYRQSWLDQLGLYLAALIGRI